MSFKQFFKIHKCLLVRKYFKNWKYCAKNYDKLSSLNPIDQMKSTKNQNTSTVKSVYKYRDPRFIALIKNWWYSNLILSSIRRCGKLIKTTKPLIKKFETSLDWFQFILSLIECYFWKYLNDRSHRQDKKSESLFEVIEVIDSLNFRAWIRHTVYLQDSLQ